MDKPERRRILNNNLRKEEIRILSHYKVLNAVKTGHSETHYASVLARSISRQQGQIITAPPPLTIECSGEPCSEWQIWGVFSQNGIPEPNSKVDVNGVGDKVTLGEHKGEYEIPVSVNGNVVSTVYLDSPLYEGDYIRRFSDDTAVLHRENKTVQLEGNENWDENDIDNFFITTPFSDAVPLSLVKCTNQVSVSTSYADENCFISADKKFNFQTAEVTHSADDFKSFLLFLFNRHRPVTFYYKLSTPVETPIILPKIQTVSGTNVIDVETTIKPPNMYMKYR